EINTDALGEIALKQLLSPPGQRGHIKQRRRHRRRCYYEQNPNEPAQVRQGQHQQLVPPIAQRLPEGFVGHVSTRYEVRGTRYEALCLADDYLVPSTSY